MSLRRRLFAMLGGVALVTTPANRHHPKHGRRPLPIPAVFNGAAYTRTDLLGLVIAVDRAGGLVGAALLFR